MQIITDSSAEISETEAEQLGVKVIPLTIIFGDTAYAEGSEIAKDEFYRRLKGGEFPHTSLPSAEVFKEFYAACNGEETLVLPISSALSGTYQTACIAAKEGGFGNVHVFDTLCTTAMLRLLVEEAVKYRALPVSDVIERLKELRPKMRLYACPNTLEYLYKGGRIKRSIAIVGGLLGIKPVLTVNTSLGTVELCGKAHGKKALAVLAEHYKKDDVDTSYPVWFLQTDTDESARQLMRDTDNENAHILQICCAVGSHIGPRATGIVYVVK